MPQRAIFAAKMFMSSARERDTQMQSDDRQTDRETDPQTEKQRVTETDSATESENRIKFATCGTELRQISNMLSRDDTLLWIVDLGYWKDRNLWIEA